ncbi:hypothetical protein SD427_12165 [Chryseobacterium sp. JJR-5R]|uniref:hypothetical protein n=1 Tax=Chryseobacterium sp. JJR-5R TaxID=3093923 RepID=UPI002A7667D5|nr:hypothetical protein [Chryseobacterium sp. JJR-5R]WPO81517.1 hypothetical protein SD427_12165 [Chryseobacterium sp. JJR-5R]
MKKLMPLFLIFAFTNLFSQEYHFDYYIQYKYEIKRNKEQPEIMDFQYAVNSQDHSYDISFRSGKNRIVSAVITDFKNSLQHYFEIRNTGFSLKENNFNYIYSVKMPSVKKQFEEESKRRFFTSDFIDKGPDGLSHHLIKEFNNQKLKEPRMSAEVVFADFKDDLSFVGLCLLFDYHEIYDKLKFGNKFILKSASGKSNNFKIDISLEAVEPQNFDIKINQDQLSFKKN